MLIPIAKTEREGGKGKRREERGKDGEKRGGKVVPFGPSGILVSLSGIRQGEPKLLCTAQPNCSEGCRSFLHSEYSKLLGTLTTFNVTYHQSSQRDHRFA